MEIGDIGCDDDTNDLDDEHNVLDDEQSLDEYSGDDSDDVVHSIGDSDSAEDYIEDEQSDHYGRIMNIKQELHINKAAELYNNADGDDGDGIDDDDVKGSYRSNNNYNINNNNNSTNKNINIKYASNSTSQRRQYLKTHLNKEGFAKLLRYQAVKRSVNWYVNIIFYRTHMRCTYAMRSG